MPIVDPNFVQLKLGSTTVVQRGLITRKLASACRHTGLRRTGTTPRQNSQQAGRASRRRMQSALSQAPRSASSSPCETDSLQCAWSCPLSRETFEVEPQGPGEEVAGLGVAIALRRQLSDRNHPVRRLSNLNFCRILRIGTHVPLVLAGLASCPVRREGSGAHRSGCGHPFVPLRRDAERSRAATSTGRHSPACHGARFSFAHVRARDCDGVCFGQLTCATRLP